MTNEEAIKRLKYTDACDTDLCEAIDIAIKSLEKDINKNKKQSISKEEYDHWLDNGKDPFCGEGW